MMDTVHARRIRLWQERIETQVNITGNGPPLVYLHGPWGLRIDADFIERLGQNNTVYAPMHPGTTPGDPEAIHELADLYDLVVYHAELFDRLDIGSVPVIGHSFGGMLACEISLASMSRVGQLVLIDPVGLWRDDLPVRNWMVLPDAERRSTLFADPDGEAARRFFSLPDVDAQADFIWSQACTGKFVWPIPDKGLKKRIHRITAPTLIVWGTHDRVIPSPYATEFANSIAGSRVELVDGAGHLAHLEQPDVVAGLVRRFLTD